MATSRRRGARWSGGARFGLRQGALQGRLNRLTLLQELLEQRRAGLAEAQSEAGPAPYSAVGDFSPRRGPERGRSARGEQRRGPDDNDQGDEQQHEDDQEQGADEGGRPSSEAREAAGGSRTQTRRTGAGDEQDRLRQAVFRAFDRIVDRDDPPGTPPNVSAVNRQLGGDLRATQSQIRDLYRAWAGDKGKD